MKNSTWRTLASFIQLLAICELVSGRVFPQHYHPPPRNNYSDDYDTLEIFEDDLLPDFEELLKSSDLSMIDFGLQSQLMSHLVVPHYLQNSFDTFGSIENRVKQDQRLDRLFNGIESESCKGHVLEWIIRSENLTVLLANVDDVWALHMLDSWAKPPDGILSGHVSAFGDFNECIGIKVTELEILNKYVGPQKTSQRFEGRYCTTYIADYGTAMAGAKIPIVKDKTRLRSSSPSEDGYAKNDHTISESVSLGEFLELFTSGKGVRMIPSLGACFPNSCSQQDIQQLMINYIDMVYTGDALQTSNAVQADYNPEGLLWPYVLACYEEKKPDFDAADISVMVILAAFGVLGLATGAVDYYLNHGIAKPPRRGTLYSYLMAFSLYSNVKSLVNTKRHREDIGCVHGLRFFSTSWIILAHTYFAVTMLPQWNMVDVKKAHEDFTVITVLNSSFAVDTFFVIGGMLVCYNLIKMLDRSKGKLNLFTLYVKRYLRLTPPYAILVGLMATLFPYMGNGPYWAVMNQWGTFCSNNWWTNLLYINNIAKTNQMCNGESWYLANDMQFYILAPLIVYPIWKWEMIGLILLAIYTVLSVISPALVVHFMDISPTVIPTRDLGFGPAFTHLYIRPYVRIQTYLVGIWLGWILTKTKGKKVNLHPLIVTAFWLIATAAAPACIYAIFPWFNPWNDIPKWGSLAYAGLSRFAFGIVVAWIIFACIKGYAGIVDSILSWKVFMPLARLCYCVYLVSLHLQMILHVRFTQPIKYDPYVQANFFLAHMVMSFLAGLPIWLLFEQPFLILQKYIFDGTPPPRPVSSPSVAPQRGTKRNGIYYNDLDTILNGGENQSKATTTESGNLNKPEEPETKEALQNKLTSAEGREKRYGIYYNGLDAILKGDSKPTESATESEKGEVLKESVDKQSPSVDDQDKIEDIETTVAEEKEQGRNPESESATKSDTKDEKVPAPSAIATDNNV